MGKGEKMKKLFDLPECVTPRHCIIGMKSHISVKKMPKEDTYNRMSSMAREPVIVLLGLISLRIGPPFLFRQNL